MIFMNDRKNAEFFRNSAVRWEKFISEIYLLNACKLGREVNLFDFYVESIYIY